MYSSASLAGAVSKGDLRRFLHWAVEHLGYTALIEVEKAAPTAELEPIREGFAPQTDEQVCRIIAFLLCAKEARLGTPSS